VSDTNYNQFDKLAQQVWTSTSIEDKKEILTKMVESFKFKDKQRQFYDVIKVETSLKRLDKIAADLMLVGHGDAVLK